MEHAYFIVHIDNSTNDIKGANIYSEWPLSSLASLTRNITDVCIFHVKANTYHEARALLIQQLLGFPMVQTHK